MVRPSPFARRGSLPIVEAEGLYGSLQRLGVPTSLAIYPGMGHQPGRPDQMIDMAERSLAWFDRYLKGR